LGNLANAALAGQKSGALGFLVTDWGDLGHMQPLPVSYFGFLVGACVSWNTSTAEQAFEIDWMNLLNLHAFQDKAEIMGAIAYSLGEIYQLSGGPTFNASPLFRMLVLAETRPPSSLEGLTKEGIHKAITAIQKAVENLPKAQMQRDDSEAIIEEFRWCADILLFACNFGLARMESKGEDPATFDGATKKTLLRELERLLEEHQRNWMRRYRSGGFTDSAQRLTKVKEMIRPSPTLSPNS